MYKLTEYGRKNIESYISELQAKRKEILDAGKDTIDETPDLPTVDEIFEDLMEEPIDDDGEVYNGWFVTDNYDADRPVLLKLGRDFIEVSNDASSGMPIESIFKKLETDPVDAIAFSMANRIVYIQEHSEEGYEYTICDSNYVEIDGGFADEEDETIGDALSTVIEWIRDDERLRGDIKGDTLLVELDAEDTINKINEVAAEKADKARQAIA